MRPGMRADGMPGSRNLLQDFGIVGRVFADRKENAGRTFVRECLQDRGGVDRPRSIVKGQHDFMVAQEIQLLEVLETEARSSRGIDFDGAANSKRVRSRARSFRR